MSYRAWLANLRFWSYGRSTAVARLRRASFQPRLELLEERAQPSVTPIHLYDLNGSLTDALGGPSLVANGGTLTDTRYVFGANQGLRLSGGLEDTTDYSIAFVCNLNTATAFFKKILDFQARTSDSGLYVAGSHMQLFPGGPGLSNVAANTDFHVTVTRDSASGLTHVYFNGVLDVTYSGSASNGAISANNILTFFEDDLLTRSEAVAGSVDYIAIFDRPLTAAEVADLSIHPPTIAPTLGVDQASLTVNEGQTATNTGTWSNAASLSASVGNLTTNSDGTWSWSFTTNDGPEQTQTVTITALGVNGTSVAATFELNVNDVAPAISISGVSEIDEGTQYTLNLFAADSGLDTILEWTINWGDGSVDHLPGNTTAATHVYRSQSSAFMISASVTDDDGTHAAANAITLTVNNVAPSVSVTGGGVSVNEGQVATIEGAFSDAGRDNVTLTASVGNVTSNGAGGWTWSFNTADGPAETQVVTITATDDDGAGVTATFQLTVENAPPTITSLTASNPTNGLTTISGLFADPGLHDTHTVIVSWGDGAPEQVLTSVDQVNGAFSGTHHYLQAGAFTITVTVRDNDGAAISRTATVVVALSGVSLVDGVLYVAGSSGKDLIRIDQYRRRLPHARADKSPRQVLRVSLQLNVGAGKSSRPSFYYFDVADVKQIVIVTAGGKDAVRIAKNVTIDATLVGTDHHHRWIYDAFFRRKHRDFAWKA